MDLHEWEILSDDGLLDYKDDDEKKIISANKRSSSPSSDAKIMFDMNYFLCPSSMDYSKPTSSRLPKQLMVPVHLQLDSPIVIKVPDDDDDSTLKEQEKEKEAMVIGVVDDHQKEGDQDTVTQVFFKKMKENEFVDMKIDSPRSSNNGTKAQIDVVGHHYQLDEGGEATENNNITNSPRMNLLTQKGIKEDDNKEEIMNWDGSNILKWSLNGIGAICSFGVAAATVCILFYGGNQQKLRIQIYTNDKKLKQAVQQATRLNEAISAARRLPQTRAHITCGGHYDML